MKGRPQISLIVATRNRCHCLIEFLTKLKEQSQSISWELVLVDNGSTDDTWDFISLPDASRSFKLIALQEPLPGKSRALNTGIKNSSGELLVFSDDDVHPDPQWLSELANASLRRPEAQIFGGRVRVPTNQVPYWITNSTNLQEMLLSEHDLGAREIFYPHSRYPIGPNMAVRRSALSCYSSCWPVHLGPGTMVPLGDEQGFLRRISSWSSLDRLYVPTAIVEHIIDKEHVLFLNAFRRCFIGGLAAGYLNALFPCPAISSIQSIKLAQLRLSTIRSLPEFACGMSRFLGVLMGRLYGLTSTIL